MTMSATASRYGRRPDTYDGLDSDEEEEERRLSQRYGEAADDAGPSSKRRRGGPVQQETTLTEEDAAAAKEFEEKVRRKKARPALTPAELKGEKGLVFVRRSFPAAVKRFRDVPLASKVRGTGARSSELARRMNAKSQIDAAAQYSRSLMGAFRDFGRELFPSLAVEDVFLKIEDLGKKKEVKDYLQIMREESRKEYLEGLYGADKAGRILNELQYGLRAMRPAEEDYGGRQAGDGGVVAPRIGRAVNWEGDDGEEGGAGITPPESSLRKAVVANPYAKKAQENNDEDNEDGSPEKEGVEKVDGTGDDETMVDAVVAETSPSAGKEEEATLSVNSGDNADNISASEVAKDDFIGPATTEKQNENANENNTVEPATEKPDGIVEKADEINTDEPTEPVAEKQDDNVEKADETIADEPTEPVTENRDGAVGKADKSNSDEPTEPATEKQDHVVEKADKSITEVGYVGKDLNEFAPLFKTQKTTKMTASAGEDKLKATSEIADESSRDVINNDIQFEKHETPTQEVNNNTQETLTLMESQLDDVTMDYTQDERFSQGSLTKEVGAVETPTQVADDGGLSQTQDERFSQTQEERFPQNRDGAGANENDDDGFPKEEENTVDERFSQFTQGSNTMNGPIFEEDGCGGEDGVDCNNDVEENGNGSDQLGQTMNTQLSMEY